VRAGLPRRGTVIYTDLGGEELPVRTLFSWEYGLKGRPDALIRVDGSVIPVEYKSSRYPRSGRPYENHTLQLACYCLLVAEDMKEHVPYGIVRYDGGLAHVEYTAHLRSQLLSILEEMRRVRGKWEVHCSHSYARRCEACGFNKVCGESLV
jgi:CRISPR-associated protein Cas4